MLEAAEIWERLIAEHWTSLPLFTADHFYGCFAEALPRRRLGLARAVDAFVARGPVGDSGGAEAAAVLATTTAPGAD